MRLDVYVPVLFGALLGIAVGPLSRRLPPSAGMRALVVAGALGAVGWLWALGLLAWTGIGQLPAVARIGGWSPVVLRADTPVAAPIAGAAAAVLLAVTAALAIAAATRGRAVVAGRRLARRMAADAATELVVLPDPVPEAFALPSLGAGSGHIVVSAGMLRALDAAERRVLFAHERAHLRGAHHWWLLVAHLVAAADPLLARLPAAVGYLSERAADEAAAEAVADRSLAARALARAGLATLRAGPVPRRGLALSHATTRVQARVSALLSAPPPACTAVFVGLAVAVLLAGWACVDAGYDLEQLFDIAMRPG